MIISSLNHCSTTGLAKAICSILFTVKACVCFQRDCPDGQLSKEKFKEVYAQFFPGGNPDEFCEHVFRSFDKDHSGAIEFKEFLMAINITSQKGKAGDKLNWAFGMYDIDGNGTIEKKEMECLIGVSTFSINTYNTFILIALSSLEIFI